MTESNDKNKRAELATAFYSKGRKLWAKGEKEEALELFRKSVAIQESALGTYHKNTARTYYWIGYALKCRDEFDKALVAYRRTLRIRMLLFGEEDISTEDVLRAVKDVLHRKSWSDDQIDQYVHAISKSVEHQRNGGTHADEGEYAKAVVEYFACLAIEEAAVGRFPLDSAELQAKIGHAHNRMREFDKAINAYRNSLCLYEPSLGRDHPDTTACLTAIEVACTGKGLDEKSIQEYSIAVFDSIAFVERGEQLLQEQQYEKSIESFELAIQLEETSLGRDPLTVADIYRKMAGTFLSQEKYDRAILVLRTALSIYTVAWGNGSPNVTATLKQIGSTLQSKGLEKNDINKYLNTVYYSVKYERNGEEENKKGNYKAAMEEFQKSLALEASGLGKYHLTQAALFRGIGNAYIGAGNFDNAIVNYRQALYVNLPNLGDSHPSTKKTIRRLIYAAEDMGMSREQITEYRENVVKSVDAEIKGDLLLKVDNIDKAIGEFRKAIELEEASLGSLHICTAGLYAKIALALKLGGYKDRALAAYRGALAVNQIRLGPNHNNTAISLTELKAAAQRTGMSEMEATNYCQTATAAIEIEEKADNYAKSGSFEEASREYRKAIDLEESALGQSCLTMATLFSKIGEVYRLKGEFRRSILVCRNALRILFSFQSYDAAGGTMATLGLAIQGLGFSETTATRYQRVVRDSIDHEHAGERALEKNERDKAVGEFRRAITLEESVLGKLSVTTSSLHHQIAEISIEREDYESALLFYSRSLAIQESYLGKDNEDVLRTYNDLVLTAERLGTERNAGVQGWATLKFILMSLISLLVMISTIVETMAKKESPIKRLTIAAMDNDEASPRATDRPTPILKGSKFGQTKASGAPTSERSPSSSDDSFVMVQSDGKDGEGSEQGNSSDEPENSTEQNSETDDPADPADPPTQHLAEDYVDESAVAGCGKEPSQESDTVPAKVPTLFAPTQKFTFSFGKPSPGEGLPATTSDSAENQIDDNGQVEEESTEHADNLTESEGPGNGDMSKAMEVDSERSGGVIERGVDGANENPATNNTSGKAGREEGEPCETSEKQVPPQSEVLSASNVANDASGESIGNENLQEGMADSAAESSQTPDGDDSTKKMESKRTPSVLSRYNFEQNSKEIAGAPKENKPMYVFDFSNARKRFDAPKRSQAMASPVSGRKTIQEHPGEEFA